MTLTPDDIERRTFAIEARGYDRDEVRKFLFEVASRLSLTMRPTGIPRAGLLDDAELAAEEIRADAREAADHIRRGADTDATQQRERARRLLIAAKEQSDAIVAEAEAQARAVLTGARDQAEQQVRLVEAQARRQAELILRSERDALTGLHDAKAGVLAAIDALAGSTSQPVVDLTEYHPHVHLGEVSISMGEPASAPTGAEDPNRLDPLVKMVRHAVDRAVEHAELIDDEDAGRGPAIDPDPPDTPATDADDTTGSGGSFDLSADVTASA